VAFHTPFLFTFNLYPMTSQFKTFLKFVANAAIVLLLIAVVVPGIYRATQKVPPSSADVTQLLSADVQNFFGTNLLLLTFDQPLPSPTAGADNCDLNPMNPDEGAVADTCYVNKGLYYLDNGTAMVTVYIARAAEFAATLSLEGYTTSQAVALIAPQNGPPIIPNPAEDTFTLTPSGNFTGVSELAGTYLVGCSGNCTTQPGNGVNNLFLTDSDTTGSGLDGRDFSVTWVPKTGQNVPAGYQSTRIYIVNQNTALTSSNVTIDGCGGNPCMDKGFFNQYNQSAYSLAQMEIADSSGSQWNPIIEYKACVLIDATADTLDCSPEASVTADSVEDSSGSFIQHMSAFNYVSGAKMTLYAQVFDDQTGDADFQAGTDGAAIQMIYGTSSGAVTTAVSATKVSGTPNGWQFQTTATNTENLYYYLKVTDKSGNIRYFTKNPSVDMSAQSTAEQAAAAAFMVTPVVAGDYTISGTVYDASTGNAIAADSATVFLSGLAVPAVTTSTGIYEFTNIPAGSYDIGAAKADYCEQMRFETVSASKTGVNFSLNPGFCSFQMPGEGGGPGGKPHVMFSTPPEFDNFAPIDQSIYVGLDQELNPTTVNDVDATGATDKIYLTTDNGTTKIAGTVTYCSSSSSPGCSSLHPGDTNVILFTPASNLTATTGYTLVIGSGVTSTSGQSIDGNRPGGGHEISFFTSGNAFNNFAQDIGYNFGSGGQYMPPYVEAVFPGPGMQYPPNTKIAITFSELMKADTLVTANFKLLKSSVEQSFTLTADTTNKIVVLTPASVLTSGEYEVRVMGAVANQSGIPMMDTTQYGASPAFISFFEVAGSNDATASSVYPMNPNNATGVAVNRPIEFGFSEALDPSTVTVSNITLSRGSTGVSATVEYRPGGNLVIVPNNVLAPNTAYTAGFTASVTDLSGVAMTAQNFSFTTGAADTVQPNITETRCDDYTCNIRFTEPMNSKRETAGVTEWAGSVLNSANWTLQRTAPSSSAISLSGMPISYNKDDYSATIQGISGLTNGDTFQITVGTNVGDLSGNLVSTADSANVFTGIAENSAETYGFNSKEGSMFGPPKANMMTMGGGPGGPGGMMDMKATGGFGGFTPEQFFSGDAVMAYPFSDMAGMDVNVFQVRLPVSQLGIEGGLLDQDQIVLTFPTGTDITNTRQDTQSPYLRDFTEFDAGKITFDSALDSDGIAVDTASRTVTIQLDVTEGTPGANDRVTIDLRGIVNPTIPRDPSNGYTVGVKLKRAGTVRANLTSTPYPIRAAGTNTITVNVYAGSQASPVSGANGNVFIFGGGPAGPMDRDVTLTNGTISAVGGDTNLSSIVYSGLPDGCYNIGSQSNATLGNNDYDGRDRPESICVNGSQSTSYNLVFTRAVGEGAEASVPVTVKLVKAGGFGGANIDIFAGGPGRFKNKTIDNVTTPDPNGYTLYLPRNGRWHVGVGPAMPKSGGMPDFDTFGGTPPPPVELEVRDIESSGSVSLAFNAPMGVSFNDETDTLTYTVRTNSINVPVTLTDGSNPLAEVDVFMHQKGFGAGTFGRTNSSGQVTLRVADYGSYEIGAFKPGLGETFRQVDVREDSGTKIRFEGADVATVPLKIKKRDYYISGKVLDASGSGLGYAPVWASDANGTFIPGQTESDGSFTIYVSAGTWTVQSELPPGRTDTCSSFLKSITISAETGSKANQNVQATEQTCKTLTGTVTIDGSARGNTHIFIEQWDTVNNRPSGGFHRETNTNSSGVYTASVPAGTYRVGTWDPDFGELGETVVVSATSTTQNLNSGTLENITFVFTGGAAEMAGFVEFKNTSDRMNRFGKPYSDASQNLVVPLKSGSYEYSMNINGVGNFTGTADTGDTVTLSLTGSTLLTLSGTVYDSNGTALPGATVVVDNFTSGIHRDAKSSADGTYSLRAKAGTYQVTVNRAEYIAGQAPATLALTESTSDYDFGGEGGDQLGMVASSKTITGTLYESDGSTPVNDARVWAQNSTGQVVAVELRDSTDGTYTLPVTEDSSWTIKAVAPRSAETTLSGAVNTADATADTGKNITLTVDATKIPKSKSQNFTATNSVTLDDTDNSNMRLVAAGGVLASTGTVTVQMEKSYLASPDEDYTSIGGVSYDLNVSDGSRAVKEFTGNAELILEYDPDNLPAGVEEADLKAVYYSTEANRYIPCEGGVAVDATSNQITCVTNHATTFAIVYPTPSSSSSATGGSSRHSVQVSEAVITEATEGSANDLVNTSANTTTNAASNMIRKAVANEVEFFQPLQFDPKLITQSVTTGERSVTLTEEGGKMTLRPNQEAGISVEIFEGTKLTADKEWLGDIQPPVVQPKDVIQESGDYQVAGDRQTLVRDEVDVVISMGSASGKLTFSEPVKVTVPVNLTDGSVVEIYSSEDGALWELVNANQIVVEGGEVVFATDHFTYFAVVSTGENILPAEEELRQAAAEEEKAEVELPFVDMKNHWGKEFVAKLYALGVVTGKTDTIFAPSATVTRAELAKMAVLAFGYDVPAKATKIDFKDIPLTAWFAPYVEVAKENNIIKGYSSGHFKPDALVNRAETLKILLEAAKVNVPKKGTSQFKDVSKNAWYFDYVNFASKYNIVSGYGNLMFHPANYINRAEAAKMIVKIMEIANLQ